MLFPNDERPHAILVRRKKTMKIMRVALLILFVWGACFNAFAASTSAGSRTIFLMTVLNVDGDQLSLNRTYLAQSGYSGVEMGELPY